MYATCILTYVLYKFCFSMWNEIFDITVHLFDLINVPYVLHVVTILSHKSVSLKGHFYQHSGDFTTKSHLNGRYDLKVNNSFALDWNANLQLKGKQKTIKSILSFMTEIKMASQRKGSPSLKCSSDAIIETCIIRNYKKLYKKNW